MGASEDGAFWLAFLRSLTARGLSGVELATSDAHQGLVERHRRGVCWRCSWQRCRNFMANLLDPSAQAMPNLEWPPRTFWRGRTIYQPLTPGSWGPRPIGGSAGI